jgi:iron(III) transport system permease protein
MMIGGDLALLPTEAYMQISGWYDMKTASVLAVALLVPAVAIFLVNRFWVGKRSYVTITGKEISLHPFPLPGWVKWGLFGLTALISLFILLVYGTLFYGAFTKAWGYDWSFTLENIRYVFRKGFQIWNSHPLRLPYPPWERPSWPWCWPISCRKSRWGVNRALDFLAILPGAIPGMFLGIGFVMAFNNKPLELTGTSAIMVLALLFWNIPTCYSAATAGLQQIGASVEDAALNLGANSFRSFKDVIIPLLKAPFLSGFVLSFLRSVTCLSVVIFLYAPSHHGGHHLRDGAGPERTVGPGCGVHHRAHHHCLLRAAPGAVAFGQAGNQTGIVIGDERHGCLYRTERRGEAV